MILRKNYESVRRVKTEHPSTGRECIRLHWGGIDVYGDQHLVYPLARIYSEGEWNYYFPWEDHTIHIEPAYAFTVENSTHSRFWIESKKTESPMSSVAEWAEDENFYSVFQTIEGDWGYDRIAHKRTLRVFEKWKALLPLEHPDPEPLPLATAVGAGWVMCPSCVEAWPADSRLALTVCVRCGQRLNNGMWDGQDGAPGSPGDFFGLIR